MRIAKEKRLYTGLFIAATPFLAFFGCLAINATDPAYQVPAGTAEADITTMNDNEVLSATIGDFTSRDFAIASGVIMASGAAVAVSSLSTKDAEGEDMPQHAGLAA